MPSVVGMRSRATILQRWQEAPEVSAHIRQQLPYVHGKGADWQETPDVSAHNGKSLPSVGGVGYLSPILPAVTLIGQVLSPKGEPEGHSSRALVAMVRVLMPPNRHSIVGETGHQQHAGACSEVMPTLRREKELGKGHGGTQSECRAHRQGGSTPWPTRRSPKRPNPFFDLQNNSVREEMPYPPPHARVVGNDPAECENCLQRCTRTTRQGGGGRGRRHIHMRRGSIPLAFRGRAPSTAEES